MTFSHLGAGSPGNPEWVGTSSWKDNSKATLRRRRRERRKKREMRRKQTNTSFGLLCFLLGGVLTLICEPMYGVAPEDRAWASTASEPSKEAWGEVGEGLGLVTQHRCFDQLTAVLETLILSTLSGWGTLIYF